LVSAVVAIGLAVAETTDNKLMMTADAAPLAKLMAQMPLFRDGENNADGKRRCLVKIL
jgi:hypothetical protein